MKKDTTELRCFAHFFQAKRLNTTELAAIKVIKLEAGECGATEGAAICLADNLVSRR